MHVGNLNLCGPLWRLQAYIYSSSLMLAGQCLLQQILLACSIGQLLGWRNMRQSVSQHSEVSGRLIANED